MVSSMFSSTISSLVIAVCFNVWIEIESLLSMFFDEIMLRFEVQDVKMRKMTKKIFIAFLLKISAFFVVFSKNIVSLHCGSQNSDQNALFKKLIA